MNQGGGNPANSKGAEMELTANAINEMERLMNYYSDESKINPKGPAFERIVGCKAMLSAMGLKAVYDEGRYHIEAVKNI